MAHEHEFANDKLRNPKNNKVRVLNFAMQLLAHAPIMQEKLFENSSGV
jgi:hypothetical protein